MKPLLLHLLWQRLTSLGAFSKRDQTIVEARESAGILPVYAPWFRECIRLFEAAGFVETNGDRVVVARAPELREERLWEEWEDVKSRWLQDPGVASGHPLLEATVRSLGDILTGRLTATQVIFPNSSVALVENAYKNNPMSAFFSRCLATVLVGRVLASRAVDGDFAPRIVEVGAGTGATTGFVLAALRDRGIPVREYLYTDISRAFLNHAEQAYAPQCAVLKVGLLNIEVPVGDQGVDVGGYDVVIAANVLHATKSIRSTLRNTKALLKRHGLLLLNEMTANTLFNHLTFGLLEGWWLTADPELRLPGSPGLSVESWRDVLEAEGFEDVSFPARGGADTGQQVIVAISNGIVRPLVSDKALAAGAQPATRPDRRDDASAGAAAAPPPSLRGGRLTRCIVEELASSLRIDPHRIRVDEPFSTYGLDSILAVQLTSTLNEKLQIDLDITVLFEHNTVEALRSHVKSACGLDEGQDEPADIPPVGAVADGDRAVADGARDANAHGDRNAAIEERYAIIGMSGRFPKADDVDAFWSVIEEGRSCIGTPPVGREDWRAFAHEELEAFRAGFLDDAYDFDAAFFAMAPSEAALMPPEQRMLMACVWNALEDAGYTPRAFGVEPTGVFVATAPSEFAPSQTAAAATEGLDAALRMPAPSSTPNRISYLLNLHGPSEVCETACSSSLVAVHRAVRAIAAGECAQAIVAAVNLVTSPAGFRGMAALGMLSPSGLPRPFQEGADGTARGEGVGALVIKPLGKALRDGDFVYAVVRGTGVAHGGRGVSFTAPNVRGMKFAMAQAYRAAGIDPATVSYVEAHGMSTALADATEAAALAATFASDAGATNGAGDAAPLVHFGSLKPCIGHTEVFSGMAAVIKTVLAMRHGVIPGIPGFGRLQSGISLEGTRLRVAAGNLPWTRRQTPDGRAVPRRAGVNSFGLGGVNAHVLLEESEERARPTDERDAAAAQIVILSARDEERLRLRAASLAVWLRRTPEVDLADLAYTLQVGREPMECRAAFVARTRDEAAAVLEALGAEDPTLAGRIARGTEGERSAEIVALMSTSTGDAVVRSLAAEGRLELIASYWVKGAWIDWSVLSGDVPRRRVPLPAYPFRSPATTTAVSLTCTEGTAGLVDFVASLVASALGMPKSTIDRARPLGTYGLNSLLTVSMLGRIRSAFPSFRPEWLHSEATLDGIVARLAKLDVAAAEGGAGRYPELVKLNSADRGRPIFWVHGALGSVETFQAVAARTERPFYGIQARGFMTDHAPIEGIDRMAAYYLEIVRSVQPDGPYDLGGFCLGGILSYEIARQLQRDGGAVRSLVMIDSPDNTGFAVATAGKNVSSRNAALQVANTLLWPTDAKDPRAVAGRLIHRDEIDAALGEDAFVDQLAALVTRHGLPMAQEAITAFIKRNLRVQQAYKIGEYQIRPLSAADAIDCTYFRNASGLFLGDLEPYFQAPGESFSLDHVNYWRDWQRELKRLRMLDVEAANHMTMLQDDRALAPIVETCERLYAN
ncbi:MAG: thioesterase domain-containing protein [Polyangiaceae bacterium]|nr:thioesterase domain-containing protein [Polyangiaceae bacterium]